jgi:carbamoyltransferase
MPTYILGLSCFYHDSAAALVKDGKLSFAAQEERFSRIRFDSSFPLLAIQHCLEHEGIRLDDVSEIVYYEDPNSKFGRVLSSFASSGIDSALTFSRIFPNWLKWKRTALKRIKTQLSSLELGSCNRVRCIPHHRSHAASAFYPSPFSSAAVLCVDSVGEWHSTSIWHGKGNKLELVNTISYPNSLGLLYSAFTYYCGFKVDSGEYKLMGLAPYGEPKYQDLIKDNLINIHDDASFSLNLDYFAFIKGKRMISSKFEDLFGGPARKSESAITQKECDLAASVQKVAEKVMLKLAKYAMKITGEKNLCLAGGLALNCVSNCNLSYSKNFESIWVPSAPGDSGGALGAALDASIEKFGRSHLDSNEDPLEGAYLGPSYSKESIEKFLVENNYSYGYYDESTLYKIVSNYISQGLVVGWFQGRMEFGPRALGARSILGDPRNKEMQKKINTKIKFRESFRPFAPSILLEEAENYFDISEKSPYMSFVSQVADNLILGADINDDINPTKGLERVNEVRSEIPAVTHVDYSARVQTVSKETTTPFRKLLESFNELTGCPLLINTSFNVRGEPIVCTPADAYTCFIRTNMDVLVLGPFVLLKEKQSVFQDHDWREEIPLD